MRFYHRYRLLKQKFVAQLNKIGKYGTYDAEDTFETKQQNKDHTNESVASLLSFLLSKCCLSAVMQKSSFQRVSSVGKQCILASANIKNNVQLWYSILYKTKCTF